MRCSLVIISSYVRMLRTSFSENASHGMGERANAERASSEERASKRNPATTKPGLGVDVLRMIGSGVAASTVRIVDRIVTPLSVEPVAPSQRGELDLLRMTPPALRADDLGLVQADHRL